MSKIDKFKNSATKFLQSPLLRGVGKFGALAAAGAATAGVVKKFMNGVTQRLNEKSSSGSIRSIRGRKCRFDLWEPDSFSMNKALPYKEALKEYGETTRLKRAYSYKALNRLIQASAADMTKQAMLNLYKEGVIPLIQIHDEIAVSVKDKNVAKDIATTMENAVKLEVPNKCDVDIGPSWGEATSC